MNLFILIISLYVVSIIVSGFIPKKSRNIFVITFNFIILYIIHSLKDWDSLPDLGAYSEIFYDSNMMSYIEQLTFTRFEPGWLLMNRILYNIYPDHIILSLFTSLAIVGSYFVAIRKYSVMPALSILLYILTTYNQSLFVLRQHMAVAILFFSIRYILNRDFMKFLLIWLMACSLHMTAFIFLPAYFIYSFRLNKRFLFLTILMCFLMALFFQLIVVFFTSGTYIGGYINEEVHGTWTGTCIMLCILMLSLVTLKITNLERENKLFFQLLCIGLCFEVGGAVSSFEAMGRLNYYYTVYAIFIIPKALLNQPVLSRFLITCCVLLGYGTIWYSFISSINFEDFKLIF